MFKDMDYCVGCPQGCINCGRKHVTVPCCDDCEEELDDEAYDVDGDMLCADCALKRIKAPIDHWYE